MLNRPADLTGNKGPSGALVVESLFFPLLFHDLRRCGLLASYTRRATCVATVQRSSAFVEVKRGCGYTQVAEARRLPSFP